MKVDGPRLLDTFRRYLDDHGLPVTQQRLAVAEAIFFAGDHVSAEDIADRVAKRGGPVGTAKVYRTLELLVVWGGDGVFERSVGADDRVARGRGGIPAPPSPLGDLRSVPALSAVEPFSAREVVG